MSEQRDNAAVAPRLAAALQVVLGAIAFGVPILYAMGRVYIEGYWSGLQLPASLARYGVEDYLYLGFIGILNSGARLFASLGFGAVRYVVVAVCVLALLAFYAVALDKLVAPTLQRLVANFDAKIVSWEKGRRDWWTSVARMAMTFWFVALILTMFLFVLFFVAVLPVAFMHKAGGGQAAQVRKTMMEGLSSPVKSRALSILYYQDADVRRASLLLECSEQWCVVYEGGVFNAVRTDDVIRIEHCRRRLEIKNGTPSCVDQLAKAGRPSVTPVGPLPATQEVQP